MSEKYLKTREKLISKIENKLLKLNNSLKLVIEADAKILFNQSGGALGDPGALDKLIQVVAGVKGEYVDSNPNKEIEEIKTRITMIGQKIEQTTGELEEFIRRIKTDPKLLKKLKEELDLILQSGVAAAQVGQSEVELQSGDEGYVTAAAQRINAAGQNTSTTLGGVKQNAAEFAANRRALAAGLTANDPTADGLSP